MRLTIISCGRSNLSLMNFLRRPTVNRAGHFKYLFGGNACKTENFDYHSEFVL